MPGPKNHLGRLLQLTQNLQRRPRVCIFHRGPWITVVWIIRQFWKSLVQWIKHDVGWWETCFLFLALPLIRCRIWISFNVSEFQLSCLLKEGTDLISKISSIFNIPWFSKIYKVFIKLYSFIKWMGKQGGLGARDQGRKYGDVSLVHKTIGMKSFLPLHWASRTSRNRT